MKLKLFTILCLLVTAVLSQDQPSPAETTVQPSTDRPTTQPPPTPQPTTTEPTTIIPSTLPPTTTNIPTTPEPTTTVPPTTPPPTTPKPTTTPTTTEKPTTRPATTTKPTTPPTTTAKPTTTPRPTTTLPPVVPDIPQFPKNNGTWSVTGEGRKSPCILLKGALRLHVTKNVTDFVADVPDSGLPHVNVTGTCHPTDQKLVINWWTTTSTPDKSERSNTVTLKFTKETDGKYELSNIKYTYKHNEHIIINGPFFSTDLKKSYLCHSEERIQSDNETSYMLTQDFQFEAFREEETVAKGEPTFSTPIECKADNRATTGVILGIAVGIGLLVVLVIAMGIYLFKRFRRGGYQPLNTFN